MGAMSESQHARRMRDGIRGMTNAVVFLYTEIPWSVTMAWMGSYLTLFLVDQHLSPHQVGLAMGVGALLQVVGLGGSGYLARKIGRKNSIMMGDFLGWVLVLGVWALMRNPWFLALALVMNQASGFVGPAWNSLFSEDEDPARLPRYFFYLQLLTVIGGLMLPIAEPWIAHRGVVYTGHRLLLGLWPLVALVWTLRLIFLRESRAGQTSMGQVLSRGHVLEHLKTGLKGTGGILAGLRIAAQVPLVLFANLAPLALVSARGADLPASQLAYLPLAASAATVALAVLHTRYPGISNRVLIGVSLGLLLAGFALLAVSRSGDVWQVMVAWGLVIAGQSQFWTSHTTYWMTWLPDATRVDVQGWIGVITAGLVAILSPILAPMYGDNPRLIFGMTTGLLVFALVFWRILPSGRSAPEVPPR